MARGKIKPGLKLGKACRACGADEWRLRGSTKRRVCVPCDRTSAKRRGAAVNQDPPFRLYRSAVQRASRSGVPLHLTADDIRAVWPTDKRCPALGIPLSFGAGVSHDASPTLDRLNSEWGYEPGNIAVISLAANRAKGGLRAEDLERIAAWMRGKGLS